MNKVSVLKTKSPMDRKLLEIGRQRFFELWPEAVRYLERVLTSDETEKVAIGRGANATVIEVPKFSVRDKLYATNMLVERVIPTLQAIKLVGEGFVGRQSSAPQVDWQAMHREALAVLAEEAGERPGNGAVH